MKGGAGKHVYRLNPTKRGVYSLPLFFLCVLDWRIDLRTERKLQNADIRRVC